MDRPQATSLAVRCDVLLGLESQVVRECPSCQGELDLHQPDLEHPQRLLGTCPGCGSWFIVDESGDGSEVLLVRIPETTTLTQMVQRRTDAGRGPDASPENGLSA